jgi:tetratricopeptide (TPR) repeat protein
LSYPDAQFYAGLCHYYQDLLDRAAAIYTELTRLFPTAGVYNNLALIELKRRDFAKAMEYLNIALAANRDAVDAPFNIAYGVWLSGDHEMAIEKLREVVSRRGKDGEAHYLLAKSYAKLGRQSVAGEALEQARQFQPKVTQWERSGKVPPLGRVVRVLDRSLWYWSDQKESNDAASPPTPLSRWLDRMMQAAEQLMNQKRDIEALALLDTLLKQTPDSGRGHFLKSQIHEARSDYPSAINELRAATFWDPKLVSAYVKLGKLYTTMGENGRALENVRKALELEPNNEEALSLQQTLLRPQGESFRD